MLNLPDSKRTGPAPRCLVTGATGYVGGRLVPELLRAGYRVRVMARSPAKLLRRPWHDDVEIARADASDPAAVRAALDGVDIGYYLLHSIGTGPDFRATERQTAETVAGAAGEHGLSRLVYLGGLTSRDERLSEHLASRAEVGDVLLHSGVPTVVLRAGVIIGSGSASFEMLRYLTERLPLMITPRWVRSRVQPIAIRDVLRYLVAAATLPPEVDRGFDIGGPDVLTYQDMMRRFAAIVGLPRRRILPVPVLTPGLSSEWVGLVTPVPRGLARPLVESLRNTAVADEHDIAEHIPDPADGLLGYERSVELALSKVRNLDVPTTWSSATPVGAPSDPLPDDPDWSGGSLYTDVRERPVGADGEALWHIIEGIGGRRGWYSFPLGWTARGWIDRLSGGPGLARGRRDPDRLLPGDSLDWWRVEAIDEGARLLLRAEMRLPGLAWLEFTVAPTNQPDRTLLRQRALFHPRGAAGHAYWWAIRPFHGLVFGSMLHNIARAAEQLMAAHPPPSDNSG